MTDLDPLLREAMASVRGPVAARPSLSDVRHRARRRNHRRMAVTAVVVTCAGVATTALIIRRDSSGSAATSGSQPIDSAPTASTLYVPVQNYSTTTVIGLPTNKMTITPSSVWQALYNARYDPAGSALTIEPVVQAARDVMPTPEQFGCMTGDCQAMYTYVVWHEFAKMLGFADVAEMKSANPAIDFSIPPVEGAVLLTPYSGVPDATSTSIMTAIASNTGDVSPTTMIGCASSPSAPVVVVANASHVVGTAKWWRDNLAANVPNVPFAAPVNALAQEATSRVLALAGSECEASLIARFTTGTGFEAATLQDLQSLVAAPLPAGTAIVVLVGDDVMSKFTTGVTTTSYG